MAPAEPPGTVVGAGYEEGYQWARETRSPRPREPRPLEASCDEADEALRRVAERIARRSLRGHPMLDGPELVFALRAEGAPYVWPKVWTLAGAKPDETEVLERWQRWLGSFSEGGTRRCGVARARDRDRMVVVGVASDVEADLSPVSTTARVGQWMTVEGRLLGAASDAKLVILGPRGRPRPVPASLYQGRARAGFSLDQPGSWVIQLLGTTDRGPRPVAEALVYVGVRPPATFHASEAPGDRAGEGAGDAPAAIQRMINSARASEGLGALRRDRELDGLAEAHAAAMAKARLLGHDTGDGDPAVRAAGIGVRIVAENVAHAASLPRAHRALWASPSHRDNILFERFDAVGVGVVSDTDGSFWVCELFAAR